MRAVLLVHVVVSLLGIAAGFVAIRGLWNGQRMDGWTALLALYFNALVGIAQAFVNSPPLHALAHAQAEWPFLRTQVALVAAFVAPGRGALARFHPRALA